MTENGILQAIKIFNVQQYDVLFEKNTFKMYIEVMATILIPGHWLNAEGKFEIHMESSKGATIYRSESKNHRMRAITVSQYYGRSQFLVPVFVLFNRKLISDLDFNRPCVLLCVLDFKSEIEQNKVT